MTDPRGYSPGFQRSETSRAEFVIYPHGDDPVLDTEPGALLCAGRGEQDGAHSLVRMQTNKALGMAAGTFVANVKESPSLPSLLDVVNDDDWVDVVFTRWGEPYHVLRGLVEDVRPETIVDGSGATINTVAISGFDYGKIWTKTPVYFNRYIGENVGGGATLKAFAMSDAVFGNPADTVDTFLRSFLQTFKDKGNATWELPQSLREAAGVGQYFADIYTYYVDFADDPERFALNAHMLDFQNSFLWDLAQQWSDPQFCELFTDLLDKETSDYLVQDKAVDIDKTKMGVIFRDRPFPTKANGGKYEDSPWFELPLFEIVPQDILTKNIGKSGAERKNAFFAAPKHVAENAAHQVQLALPLWDPESIKRHGMRRMDYTSNYVAKVDQILGTTEGQRERMRDWFCLNPYYYNGTISLAHGRPDIRIGSRLRILGTPEVTQETYYVEALSHMWEWVTGIRTTIQVSRGWKGDDPSLIAALEKAASRYEVPLASIPLEATAGLGVIA